MADNIPSSVRIQANISGFNGKPATVLSLYVPEQGSVVVAKVVSYARGRIDGIDVLINNDTTGDYDMLMGEKDFQASIAAFYELSGRETDLGARALQISTKVPGSCNPAGYIEQDGMDVNGWRYRLQEAKNEAVAVLATALYVKNAEGMNRCFSMLDDIDKLMSGESVEI